MKIRFLPPCLLALLRFTTAALAQPAERFVKVLGFSLRLQNVPSFIFFCGQR